MSFKFPKAILRRLPAFLLVVAVSGCGGVDWFPEYKKLPTTPDLFSFPAKNGVAVNSTVSSDAITVAGLTADTSPVSVTGPAANSAYSINGGTATSAPGTVKNGDKVTLSHTSAANAGVSVSSTLTIGNVTGTFTSTTARVTPLTFTPITAQAGYKEAYATVNSSDSTANPHVISIRDSSNSGSAGFAVTEPSALPTSFTSGQLQVVTLNGLRIYVRNTEINVANGVTTTLTVDGVDFVVPLNQ